MPGDQIAADSSDEPDERVAPVERAADARGDLAVVGDLLPYLKPYSARITLALALVIAAKLANLAVPFFLKEIVDQLNVEPSLLVMPVALKYREFKRLAVT